MELWLAEHATSVEQGVYFWRRSLWTSRICDEYFSDLTRVALLLIV